ncbi:hypothetical protein Drorol1_Dr00001991 [Drosera rotundifolia]
MAKPVKRAEFKQDCIRQTLEKLNSESSGLLMLTVQWKDLEDHFDSARGEIRRGIEEIEAKEARLGEGERKLDEKRKEIEAKERELDEKKSSVAKRTILLERRERNVDETESKVSRREKELGFREKEARERIEEVRVKEMEFETKLGRFETEKRLFEEKCREFESRTKRRSEEIELMEKKLEVEKKEIAKRGGDEVGLKERNFVESVNGFETKEREFEEKCKEFESRTKRRWEELEITEEKLELEKVELAKLVDEVESKEKQHVVDVCEFKRKERDFEEKCKEFELRTKRRLEEIEVTEEKLELEKVELAKLVDEVESKEKQYIVGVNEFKQRESEFEEKLKEFELRAKQRLEEIEATEKKLEIEKMELTKRFVEVGLKEKKFVEYMNGFKGQKREFEENRKDFDSKTKRRVEEVDVMEKKLEIEKKELAKRFDEIELKEKEFMKSVNGFHKRERELEEKVEEIRLKEEQLQRMISNHKAKALANKGELLVVKPEALSDVHDDNESEDVSLKLCVKMDGKALQMFLNDRFDEHGTMSSEVLYALGLSSDPARLVLNAMDGFFPPHLKKGDVGYETVVVRKSCMLLLEQLLNLNPSIKRIARREAWELAIQWSEKLKSGEKSYAVVYAFLLVVAIYHLAAEFDTIELESFLCMLDENSARKLYLRLGFSAEILTQVTGSALELYKVTEEHSQWKTQQEGDAVCRCSEGPQNELDLLGEEKEADHNASPLPSEVEKIESDQSQLMIGQAGDTDGECSVGPRNELDFICQKMDSKSLRLYLNVHEKQENMQNKVLEALRFASDPALLVFHVLQAVYRPALNFDPKYTNRTGCNLLLELLMKLSPDIDAELKSEVLKYAWHWRSHLGQKSKPWNVFAFLALISAYKLDSFFARAELLFLFGTFYQKNVVYLLKQNVDLCRRLSLEDRIPGIVETLISEEKLLQAIRFICAFDLVDRFPLFPLLEQYLASANMARSEVTRRKRLKRRKRMEIAALKGLVKCASLCKGLETMDFIAALTERIMQLEDEKAERKKNNSSIVPVQKKTRMLIPNPGIAKLATGKRPANASVPNLGTQSSEQGQEKRPRLDPETKASGNTALGTVSTMQSIEPHPPEPSSASNAVKPGSTSNVNDAAADATSRSGNQLHPMSYHTPSPSSYGPGRSGGASMGSSRGSYPYIPPLQVGSWSFPPARDPWPIRADPAFYHGRPPHGFPVQFARPTPHSSYGMQYHHPPAF